MLENSSPFGFLFIKKPTIMGIPPRSSKLGNPWT
jgi:hypothetical protein